MKATISAREPNILQDAKPAALFLVHTPALTECVCALAHHRGLKISAGGPPSGRSLNYEVVVLACRVDGDEPGHHFVGEVHQVDANTPITFVEQVEPVAFRERRPAQVGDLRELIVKTTVAFEAPFRFPLCSDTPTGASAPPIGELT